MLSDSPLHNIGVEIQKAGCVTLGVNKIILKLFK